MVNDPPGISRYNRIRDVCLQGSNLFTADGKKVISETRSVSRLETSQLAKRLYFYEVILENNERINGKRVKKIIPDHCIKCLFLLKEEQSYQNGPVC